MRTRIKTMKWTGLMALVALASCAEGKELPAATKMVSITTGLTFPFGANQGYGCLSGAPVVCAEGTSTQNLYPQVTIALEPFAIDEHEVTNLQYQYCVDAGKCHDVRGGNSMGRDVYYDDAQFAQFPVVNVTWDDAQQYCAFVGARLPSEAEWERAAKGPGDDIFPTSEVTLAKPLDCVGQLNLQGCGESGLNRAVMDSPEDAVDEGGGAKVYDMAANVAEWTGSDWAPLNFTCADTPECVAKQCPACDTDEDPDTVCFAQCETYICLGHDLSIAFTEAELFPSSGADKAYRGAHSATRKEALCTLLASERGQRDSRTKAQPFLGFRCAKSL